jgi:hypothetical protein
MRIGLQTDTPRYTFCQWIEIFYGQIIDYSQDLALS